MIGTKLGSYEISALLGKGGMGEVYRARDTKLGREVAIKVLPEAFSEDPERLARFRREAQVLASLNHPNIATLHGLEEHDGTHYLVMELVEGETLAERLSSGALSMDDVRTITKEIADGLEEAHEKGIVHRDLKPANIKITPEGRVKLLDFGLAKAFVDDTEAVDSSLSPTITRDATRAGVILGTAAYMSPEQARGKPVDKRSDIFSLGSVLYEMLTGARPFDGEMVSDVLAAVIKTEPDWNRLPPEMAPLVKRCMDKNPRERFRDIGDIRYELMRPAPPALNVASRRPLWPIALAAVVAFAIGVALSRTGDVAMPPQMVQSTILPPEGEQFSGGYGLALSPDGTRLAFTDNRARERRRIWIRRLDELDATPLERTEGAMFPFWSPDSRSLGFFATDELKIVNASGGTPRTVASAPNATGGTWNEASVILFASDPDGLLYRVDASGGDATLATDAGGPSRGPRFLPDGRHFLFNAFLPNSTVLLGDIQTGDVRELIPNALGPTFASPEWILFVPRGSGAVFAQPFDTKLLALEGEPVSLFDNVTSPGGYPSYTVSTAGQLLYEPRPAGGEGKRWMDRNGTLLVSNPIPQDAAGWSYRISPTGARLAVGGFGLGVVDLERGIFQRLVPRGEVTQMSPTWSPNGSRIAYWTTTMPERRRELRIVSADGSSDESLLLWGSGDIERLDWSPDGSTLLVSATNESGGALRLWIVRVDDASIESWLAANGNVSEPRFSPDGKWVAYRSDETGASEVYLRPFPGPGGAKRVSTAGGANPSWRGDGRELFYVDLAGNLTSVGVDAGETLDLSLPKPLFHVGSPATDESTRYDVTPDGQMFLIREPERGPLTLVQEWPQLLR